MNRQLTIIVPVYNEEGNIERTAGALRKFIENTTVSAGVLFVDDGSSDRSREIIEMICNQDSDFESIGFEENAGLSAALKAGFDHVTSPLTGYFDADMQTDPEDFNLLLKYSDDYELVTGVRSKRKDGLLKNLSSKIANLIRNAFTRDGMDDTGCPLKIIRTGYAKNIPMFNGLHRFLPAMILLQNGRIRQIPVRHYQRIAGKSNFGLSNRLMGPLADCFVYLWMKKRYIRYRLIQSDNG